MKELNGVVVPLITPFTEDDQIDIVSLQRLTDYMIRKKVSCLYPCGSTGEMIYLDKEERMTVVETVVRRANGKIPVYAHVGAANLTDTLILAKHAVNCGADGIAVVTPWYFPLSESDLINYFITVARSVPIDYPVYLYGIPQCAINDISYNVADQVATACPNVVGVKYSFADMTKIQQFMRIRNNTFSVLVGPEQLYAASSAVGGKGVVTGYAMVVPELYVDLKKALDDKNYDEASQLQKKVIDVNNILGRDNNGMANIKAILKYRGIISEKKMRAPMMAISDNRETEILSELGEFCYLNNIIW